MLRIDFMMCALLRYEDGWPLAAYCCHRIVNEPFTLYNASEEVRPVSKVPSYNNVTQKEWDEAEKLYDELPI